MNEAKRGKGRPRKGEGVTQVTFTLEPDVTRYLNKLPSGRRSEFANDALREKIAKQAISQALDEGLSDEDAKWMAVGAINREARTQGVIGDELPAEMNATAQAIVKQVQK